MKRALLLSITVTAMLGAAPFLAAADESIPASAGAVLIADATVGGEVDAGKLIGEEVYDGMGDKVGEIDSVMAGPKGKVTSMVIDVSGWLESEKLVAVAWRDLQTDPNGKIVSSLTKDSAKAAATYAYRDPSLRKQVLTESGERYVAEGAPADGTQPATIAESGANCRKWRGDDGDHECRWLAERQQAHRPRRREPSAEQDRRHRRGRARQGRTGAGRRGGCRGVSSALLPTRSCWTGTT